MDKINQRIAEELGVAPGQVAAAVELLGEGSTVPFIARYRKEKTGGLDDTQLRKLEERLGYLRELEDRRALVLKSDRRASASSRPSSPRSINGAATKVELEDLYAPFKPKRRTKAQIAREAGLEPLSEALLKNPSLDPEAEAAKFIDAGKGVADAKAALEGARHILIERIAETPDAGRRLARMAVDRGRPDIRRAQGQERGRREVLRLFRVRPAHQGHAVASRARHAARHATRVSSTSISTLRTRRASRIRPRRASSRLRHRRSWAPGRRVARRDRAARVEGQARRIAALRSADAAKGARRRRGDRRVLQQPEGSAARGAGGPAHDHGSRSRHPHRRQGRRRRPDRQGRRHDDDLPARAQARLAGLARHAGVAVHEAQGGHHQRRQRHGRARDRQARRRADGQDAGAQADQGDGVGGRRLGLFGFRAGSQGVSRSRRHPARCGVDRAAAAGSAGRARQDRAQGHRRRAISARRRPERSRALARCCGRGLRQLSRRRRQHGVGAAAGARVGPQPDACLQHRRLPRRERRLQDARRR